MSEKIKVCILANETESDHENWIKACRDYSGSIDFDVMQLSCSNWLEKISVADYNWLLAKPPGLTASFKELYDERIRILSEVLNFKIYPSPLEIYLHENKRFLYSWLQANHLPHPKTQVFYSEKEATEYIRNTEYPIVAKSRIGASGSGVEFLNDYNAAKKYLYQAFSKKGVKRRWGPNKPWLNFHRRIFHYLINPSDVGKIIKKYNAVFNDPQRGFVIFQEFIRHNYEWRVVAIGESFFAHKKLKNKDKASGSLLKSYDNPPLALFDFVKSIMDQHKLLSQGMDLFETDNGEFLINEMQCIFGQSDKIQMKVDGISGRYVFKNSQWMFEAGDFNLNESFNLRLEHIIKLTSK